MYPKMLMNVEQLFCLILCVSIASGLRTKRQVIYENDDSKDSSNDDCVTPDRQRGHCILWRECPSLRRITRWERLQTYACGFSGSEPQVCCPFENEDSDDFLPTTTRRPLRRMPTRRRTTTRNPIATSTRPVVTMGMPLPSIRPFLRRYPVAVNRTGQMPRFLPETCGRSIYDNYRNVISNWNSRSGAWPWMALIFVGERNGSLQPDCGGALVTTRHVITAAHCVVTGREATTLSPQLLSVRLGAAGFKGNNLNAVQIGVDAVRSHEEFDQRTYKNDIAVLRLNQEVRFTDVITPVCLPYDANFTQEALDGKSSTVTGFRTMGYDGRPVDVLGTTMNIENQETCKTALEEDVTITTEYICAKAANDTNDSCQAGTGDPLVTVGLGRHYYLIGIASIGKLCDSPRNPWVYTRVTKYLDWLRNNLDD